MTDLSPLFTWRSVIADKDSRLEPTSRLVALTLSLHMNERGGSCFPGIVTQAEETGLDHKTVVAHLRKLEAGGWLMVKRGGGRGNPNHYRASMPPDALARWLDRNRGETGELTSINSGVVPMEDVIRSVDTDSKKKQGNHSPESRKARKVVENEDGSITVEEVDGPAEEPTEPTERTGTPDKVKQLRAEALRKLA